MLADQGVAVAAVARRTDRLETLIEEIEQAGGRAAAFAFDVADAADCAALFDRVEQGLGPVDILVNNAGQADGHPATDISVEAIDLLMAVNVRAPFLFAREAARRMIARSAAGRIVNIASIGAFHYQPAFSTAAFYCVTKAAVVRMTEVLSTEWAKHEINVNCIAPGLIRSEITHPFLDHDPTIVARLGRGRVGEPEDLDGTLLYLVAPSSRMITGITIRAEDEQGVR